MPFPAVEYCIVCEQVRIEAHNKLAILGFYGVAPNADIILTDLEKPSQILFLFGLGLLAEEERFRMHYSLLKPDGSILTNTEPDNITISAGGKMAAGFGFSGVFDQQGRHTVVMSSDKAELFRTTFNVSLS